MNTSSLSKVIVSMLAILASFNLNVGVSDNHGLLPPATVVVNIYNKLNNKQLASHGLEIQFIILIFMIIIVTKIVAHIVFGMSLKKVHVGLQILTEWIVIDVRVRDQRTVEEKLSGGIVGDRNRLSENKGWEAGIAAKEEEVGEG
ncbi:hypothetical protein PIB30_060769 [Stylosanthes scabra]|uniref:Transmembrane protein n=1 Tax=Stylosanthes scabra TaxID=79078 RepID=A0ABU6ZJC3_9FABA|nr:hypothetical protein [Stylosanthes scabra]